MSVGWHHVPALDFFSEAVRFMTIIKPFPPIDHVSRICIPLWDFTLLETSQIQNEQDAVLVIFNLTERKNDLIPAKNFSFLLNYQ